jgi:uncharacterized membrane protein
MLLSIHNPQSNPVMPYLDLLMRVLHIFGASILVGATVFMLLAYLPAVRKLDEERRREVFAALRPKWAMLVGIGTALLLVSGLYNTAMISIRYQFPADVHYHAILGVKIVLALVVFLLAALVSGRSGAAAAMQQKLGMWLGITLLLLLATMSVAAFMKNVDRQWKDKTPTESSQVAPLYPTRG